MKKPRERRCDREEHRCGVDQRECDDRTEEHCIHDRPHTEHGGRPEQIDAPPADGRPDAERDRVHRDHDSRLAVASPFVPDEQQKRKRRHPERQTGEQRPADQRLGVRDAEELAVVLGAGHLARTTSGAHGVPEMSGTIPPLAVLGCTVSVVGVTVTCA